MGRKNAKAHHDQKATGESEASKNPPGDPQQQRVPLAQLAQNANKQKQLAIAHFKKLDRSTSTNAKQNETSGSQRHGVRVINLAAHKTHKTATGVAAAKQQQAQHQASGRPKAAKKQQTGPSDTASLTPTTGTDASAQTHVTQHQQRKPTVPKHKNSFGSNALAHWHKKAAKHHQPTLLATGLIQQARPPKATGKQAQAQRARLPAKVHPPIVRTLSKEPAPAANHQRELSGGGKRVAGSPAAGEGDDDRRSDAVTQHSPAHEDPQHHAIKSSVSPVTSESLTNVHRLKRDGRRVPDDFRKAVENAMTPSELSVRSYSEHYVVPAEHFENADDVFAYRGFKKIGKIDEGAFGVVSKAIRVYDKTMVAVKEVDLRRKRAKRLQEMKRELFVLQKVNSLHVVKLIEHFVVGQTLVIIMEFCAGGNLTAYLKENAVSEQEAQQLFKQMALSIKVLHRKCIAHRDVKLNNFLLDSTRTIVKISDFGLSVVCFRLRPNRITLAKTYCGTEPYMAPEILKRNSAGMRSYNPMYSDIWSLGVCLFAMLTRTFPFKMHTSQEGLLKAQVGRQWRFPRNLRDQVSEELLDLVWHMLDPEPDRRITVNGVVSHPWVNQNAMINLSTAELREALVSGTQPRTKRRDAPINRFYFDKLN